MGIAEIERARDAFDAGPLREKLKRWHADVDCAFRSWSEPWLHPDFRKWDITEALGYIRVPILVVQGAEDQYGTLKQIEAAEQECFCPVEAAVLPNVRHAPVPRSARTYAQSGRRFHQPAVARPPRGRTPGRFRGCGGMNYSAYQSYYCIIIHIAVAERGRDG